MTQLNASGTDTIIVKVLNPEKVGEGMSSYVVYTIKTTVISYFI